MIEPRDKSGISFSNPLAERRRLVQCCDFVGSFEPLSETLKWYMSSSGTMHDGLAAPINPERSVIPDRVSRGL